MEKVNLKTFWIWKLTILRLGISCFHKEILKFIFFQNKIRQLHRIIHFGR